MLSRILRIASMLQLAAAVALATVLIYLGAPVPVALVISVALPLLVHAVPLGIEFITGALIDRRPIARLNLIDSIRLWLSETWRSFVVFTIDQPWRADFPEPSIIHDPARPAVLLVHGYMCNRATWRYWLHHGLPKAWNIATINLEPVYAPVEEYAESIHLAVEKLRAASGAGRVTLVCHSMGGLAGRAYLRAKGHDAVARVITIDTPHHGTLFARFALGANTRQMRQAGDYVRQLAQSEEPVEFVCFASHHDNLIVPRESQILACAEAVWFEKIGHIAMTGSDEVLAKLIDVVERPVAAVIPAPAAIHDARSQPLDSRERGNDGRCDAA